MPELPEIETLCRQLREVIVDRRILSTRVIDPKLRHLPPLAGQVRSIDFAPWQEDDLGSCRTGCA